MPGGEASGIKKNKVRPGIQSEENAIFDQVVSSEEMNLEPFEYLEEQHSGGGKCICKGPETGTLAWPSHPTVVRPVWPEQ